MRNFAVFSFFLSLFLSLSIYSPGVRYRLLQFEDIDSTDIDRTGICDRRGYFH